MAEKKPNKKPVASKKKNTLKKDTPSLLDQLAPYIIGFMAIFLAACFFVSKEYVGFAKYIGTFLCGLFSSAAYTIPFFMLYLAFFYNQNLKNNVHKQKWVYMAIAVVFISVLCALFSPIKGYDIAEHYNAGIARSGGGVIGGYVYNGVATLIGPVGVTIVAIIVLLIFVTLVFGKTPTYIFTKVFKAIRGFFGGLASNIKTISDTEYDQEDDEKETVPPAPQKPAEEKPHRKSKQTD